MFVKSSITSNETIRSELRLISYNLETKSKVSLMLVGCSRSGACISLNHTTHSYVKLPFDAGMFQHWYFFYITWVVYIV